ncbi:hypothetical protein FB465_4411 [Kitasatospora atroaurantiaca]|uniref:Sporulation related protein n=2 Tax=Kitasatospora atroaurantiaca TaxID=285545 RepID=A0A561EUK8_9ACTN|nr:hypothetical protein FB465_4411 [Kitasatospora atroaurantiaca]
MLTPCVPVGSRVCVAWERYQARPAPHRAGPATVPGMETYRVMRQDDNGNRYLVAKGLSRQEAEALAAEFEARGHKQMYWVERDDARGA